MSVAPSTPTELARTALGTTTKRSVALLATAVRASAFWTAALLPLSYPVLLATGAVADHPLGFAALLAVNVVSLLLGHDHRA
jgi:hypothetical protein